MESNGQPKEMVTLNIDGQEVRVPKGTPILEAAKTVEIEIPHYCYHPHLSSPGNCRICQVEVEGAPKLVIGCFTPVQEGMVVRTHKKSEKVRATQAATMEFLLINHPLDCTVCDQSGHCKLQDYHYQYNARPSRFLEEKVHKVKAQPLGPTVMLDGERCISCTRCVRFCDEITQTSEIGLLNRGDKNVIAVNPDRPLDNPLSGTVVDLCPVGALTHKKWRFNTRIWYTKQTDSICPGCSTGCNVKVAERDGKIVQVKARLNAEVNKEWLCDEGRYGFDRFLPEHRLLTPMIRGEQADFDQAVKEARALEKGKTLILLAPDLLLEEFMLVRALADRCLGDFESALAYRERQLSKVESVLISPDYAANFRGAQFVGLAPLENLEADYQAKLAAVAQGRYDNILLVGDRALAQQDLNNVSLVASLNRVEFCVSIISDLSSALFGLSTLALPARSILESSGLMLNRNMRLQYHAASLRAPQGVSSNWQTLQALGQAFGKSLVQVAGDRELTLWYLENESRLSGISLRQIKQGGVPVSSGLEHRKSEHQSDSGVRV